MTKRMGETAAVFSFIYLECKNISVISGVLVTWDSWMTWKTLSPQSITFSSCFVYKQLHTISFPEIKRRNALLKLCIDVDLGMFFNLLSSPCNLLYELFDLCWYYTMFSWNLFRILSIESKTIRLPKRVLHNLGLPGHFILSLRRILRVWRHL